MKNIFLLFLLTPFLLSAQSFWLQDGQQWQYILYQGFAMPIQTRLTVSGDTVIQGQPVKRIVSSNTIGGFPSRHYAYAKGETVFFYSPKTEQFERMYDFSMKPGDTLAIPNLLFQSSFKYRIDSVGITYIQGQTRRLQYAAYINPNGLPSNFRFLIVEGIGMTPLYLSGQSFFCSQFLLPYYICSGAVDGPEWHLLCYQDAGIKLILNPNLCNTVSAHAPEAPEARLWPNPAADVLQLEAGEALQTLQLYDLQGRLTRQWMGNNRSFPLSSAVAPGLYIAVAEWQNGTRSQWRVVIK